MKTSELTTAGWYWCRIDGQRLPAHFEPDSRAGEWTFCSNGISYQSVSRLDCEHISGPIPEPDDI